MCTKDMPHEEVAYMVNYLSDSKLLEDWRFGKEPYSRANPPPTVSCPFFLSFSEDHSNCDSTGTSYLVRAYPCVHTTLSKDHR